MTEHKDTSRRCGRRERGRLGGRTEGRRGKEKGRIMPQLTKMALLFLSALMNSTEDPLDLKSLTFLLT